MYHIKSIYLKNLINEKESCFIKGVIPIKKAPGDVHISFHNYREVWDYLKRNEILLRSVKLTHKFSSLCFGDKQTLLKLLHNFKMEHLAESFIGHDMPSYEETDNQKYSYDYYVKIIQHLFVDEVSNEVQIANQFSLSHKKKEIDSDTEMPIIMINYDISPITMKYTLQRRLFLKFLIHICAIIGGVFSLFNIINKIILGLTDVYTEQNNNGKNIN